MQLQCAFYYTRQSNYIIGYFLMNVTITLPRPDKQSTPKKMSPNSGTALNKAKPKPPYKACRIGDTVSTVKRSVIHRPKAKAGPTKLYNTTRINNNSNKTATGIPATDTINNASTAATTRSHSKPNRIFCRP